jgi:hypothetical protein
MADAPPFLVADARGQEVALVEKSIASACRAFTLSKGGCRKFGRTAPTPPLSMGRTTMSLFARN